MSELRRDLVSGDWIILATERAKRLASLRGRSGPHELLPKKKKRQPTPVSKCPFEDLKKSGNWPPLDMVPDKKNWRVAVIPNKYPAMRHGNNCAEPLKMGPYEHMVGVGHHELAITRDHKKNWAHMEEKKLEELFAVLKKRYLVMKNDKCMVYTSTFFNWGETAGASLFHPHCQMITLPIVPPHISRSLRGSAEYFRKNKRCVHCEVIAFERKDKKRIVAENEHAIVVTPFASKQPFQVKIFPKAHRPYFEKTTDAEMKGTVSVLRTALSKIEKNLNDPDFNFFIHTAPLKDQRKHGHYHWHIEISPKISVPAGFELGTGVDINIVDPDIAAKIIKK